MTKRPGFARAQIQSKNQLTKINSKVGMFLIRNALGMRLSAEVLRWQGLVAEVLANLAGLISNSCVSDQQDLPVWFSEDTRETMLLQCCSLRL
jgi:hypothetical protein